MMKLSFQKLLLILLLLCVSYCILLFLFTYAQPNTQNNVNSFVPSKDTIGHTTWSVMHSFAANWKKEESFENLENLIKMLGTKFICNYCSDHFTRMIEAEYPLKQYESTFHRIIEGVNLEEYEKQRRKYSLYLCELHNRVNQRLEKPIFPCEMSHLDKKWRIAENCES